MDPEIPASLSVLDQVLVLIITVGLPVYALLLFNLRLMRASPARRAHIRIEVYRIGVVVPWIVSALALLHWSSAGRGWAFLGLGFSPSLGFWTSLALGGAVFAFASWQRLQLADDDEAEEELSRQLGKLEPLMPRTPLELRWFTMLSITAGVCEELLFRGYLTWYLRTLVPLPAAILIGSALFGMAHAYQGTRGILQTGVVGLILGLVYLFSGSLWIPMALHAFIDINSGLLAYDVLRRKTLPSWPP